MRTRGNKAAMPETRARAKRPNPIANRSCDRDITFVPSTCVRPPKPRNPSKTPLTEIRVAFRCCWFWSWLVQCSSTCSRCPLDHLPSGFGVYWTGDVPRAPKFCALHGLPPEIDGDPGLEHFNPQRASQDMMSNDHTRRLNRTLDLGPPRRAFVPRHVVNPSSPARCCK